MTARGQLAGISREQQHELQTMLARLSRLWAELTEAAASGDETRVAAIRREISECRGRVEAIKRSGTQGSA